MGFFSKLFGRKPAPPPASFHGFVGNQGLSLDDAAALQDRLQASVVADDVSAKINAAARLMTGRKFRECIAAYEAIAAEHPDHLGDCEGQIGAAYFFLGDFETAIRYYEQARDHGADADMMQDNIEEARQELRKRK